MSIHPSLRGVDTLRGERSVFTRIERLQKLLRDGKMQAEDSPFGLQKVRTTYKIKTAKKADTAESSEDSEDAEATKDDE